jgi:hypothetical protein
MRPARFDLAPMSTAIRVLTLGLLALPVLFLGGALLSSQNVLLGPGAFVAASYAYVWLWMRPRAFEVDAAGVRVLWPMKEERIARARIASVRRIDASELRREVGWGMRVGAGGLWGGFGWLWTGRRGIVRMYISRTDGFVWIETADRRRPWFVTPADPDGFVAACTPPR